MDKKIFIPLDFNSLIHIQEQNLKLSDYYIDYAFHSANINISENMEVTFYDKYWTSNPQEIICLDVILKKLSDKQNSWAAEIKGKIYTNLYIPSCTFFCSFIGANTIVLKDGKKSDIQKFGENFGKEDKLGNIDAFAFSSDSAAPDFSKIIGMDVNGLNKFFQFKFDGAKASISDSDGKLADSTIVLRGGGNKVEVN